MFLWNAKSSYVFSKQKGTGPCLASVPTANVPLLY